MFLNGTKWSVDCLLPISFFFAPLAIPILAFVQEQTKREVAVLAINDVYRTLGVEDGQRGPIRASPPAAFSYTEFSSNVTKWLVLWVAAVVKLTMDVVARPLLRFLRACIIRAEGVREEGTKMLPFPSAIYKDKQILHNLA